MTNRSTKTVDITVFGATGFTGALVCEHLAKSGTSDVRLAIAGRSASSLAKIKQSMVALRAECENVTVFVCNSDDRASLDKVTSATRVVITTVGPYAKYGMPLVESCVNNACDYVDITGETTFMFDTIARCHALAEKNGVAIVHACGFDSVPSDIGTLAVVEYAKKNKLGEVGRAHHYFGPVSGGASGGTIASLSNLLRNPTANRSQAMKPDALTPPNYHKTQIRDLRWPKYDAVCGSWIAPWVMEATNSRIVRRSAGLLNYGEKFEYSEVLYVRNVFQAFAVAIGVILLVLGIIFTPTYWLLERFVLPKPGEGPSAKAREQGFFRTKLIAFCGDARVVCRVDGKGDPGYLSTSRMLATAALCLLNRDQCKVGRTGGGVLTPASALGTAYIPMLAKVGVTFNVEQETV